MYTQNVFNFKFFLCLFLVYNKRLQQKDWRNESEEKIVREGEHTYATLAQQHMPATFKLTDELNEEEQQQVVALTSLQTT